MYLRILDKSLACAYIRRTMSTAKKQFGEYPTGEPRTKTVRIYVNTGELEIIDDAIALTERDQNRSAWCANVLLVHACKILGIDYPYKS
jgi:hypothetical protein